jgi:NAD(P)H-dependent FMN reductase
MTTTRPELQVLLCSTRPGRAGEPIAHWFLERAREHGKFAVVLIDLKEVALPPIDEPRHPRLRQYEHEHTRRWSAQVERADAFVLVTPEYNFSSPPALLNALDYLLHEWAYKPVGFVSYGGVSGGTRSAQMTKQIVSALKMVPMVEAVTLPFFQKSMHDGVFAPEEIQAKAAQTMLDEMARWEAALRVLRGPSSGPA